MSKFNFKLPDIGEGVMEGEIVQWLIKLGDAVSEDQPIVEVMTDKATVTITSPKTGTVVELGGKEGAIIPVHGTLMVLDLSNGQLEEQDGDAGGAGKDDDGPAATAVGDIREDLPGMSLAASPAASAGAAGGGGVQTVASAVGYFNAKPLATPATRKLARDMGVDLKRVPPTGAKGRVMKDDVRRVGQPSTGQPSTGAAPLVASQQVAWAPIAVGPADTRDLETRTPLKGMRKRIFEAMARSKHTAAHFTFVEECDVSKLKALRERLKPAAAEQGVKLSYLPFFVKATVAALKRHPSLNAAFDESTQEVVERRYYNIGIASATEQGLMVPVVKHADRLSLLDIAREIARLSDATKSGSVAADDLRGSTFTITSLGRQGGLFATPILNTPEVGIMGIHQIKQKPVVRDGQIVIGDVMLLSLSFDHRLIDGHVGAAFAYEVIAYLEEPDRLFLEMV
jgi:pyruvate dehydrogenase E2 component (dihydrolipoamide acetyltransferase)